MAKTARNKGQAVRPPGVPVSAHHEGVPTETDASTHAAYEAAAAAWTATGGDPASAAYWLTLGQPARRDQTADVALLGDYARQALGAPPQALFDFAGRQGMHEGMHAAAAWSDQPLHVRAAFEHFRDTVLSADRQHMAKS